LKKRRERITDHMERIVERWRGKRVLVFGDMILDQFIYGVTDRVSREAPVVIVRYDGTGYAPGGAANAARNVSSLGGTAVPIGFVGADDAGETLKRLLKEAGMGMRAVATLRKRPTTNKVRVMAGDYHSQRQQMLRIDREQRIALNSREQSRLMSLFRRELCRADAVILSDYNQGIFSAPLIAEAVDSCRKARVPVVADSRSRLASFRGVTSATPNEVEASLSAGIMLAGEEDLEKIGRKLIRKLSCSSILVTRGRFGMSLFERRKRSRSVGVIGSHEATDVTGAGDTVVSAVALTLAANGPMEAAMHIANAAASVVVMKRGTAVATVRELLGVLRGIRGEEV
jgi:rfaE bifunctional protein kinase chain/domain